MSIPVVDFGVYSLRKEDVTDEQLRTLSGELKRAFSQVGFLFLQNSGISEEEVERVMETSKRFFLQAEELKKPFTRKSFPNNPNHGWVALETERLNPSQPGDLKEAFNTASFHPDIKWPSSDAVAGFREIHTSFFQRCKELSLRVLRVMALSLGLDPDVFLHAHRFIGTDENGTTLRSLFYPPVKSAMAKEGQLRCGEHSDYGSITLLFQGSEGLQVCTRSGEFVSVSSVPGAVLVNIADLMQRWTSDQLVSVRHRVLLPPVGDSSTRQSLAYFVQPDDEALITCCDGSDKYPPITGGDYLMQRFSESYAKS
ncbi:2-oxoglutarate-dependent dioxygenase htyE [Fundulus heteroclitus]|uniref:2-oxoglutarate-dependent dioxygenase htyE n=1 Tax=Fundulus heteroclitus TaxID=8078 RepID=UPI00165B6153|nr:2-oxoglutarate-dependent dioxygenase htyE [Fundulus heteroclitus]